MKQKNSPFELEILNEKADKVERLTIRHLHIHIGDNVIGYKLEVSERFEAVCRVSVNGMIWHEQEINEEVIAFFNRAYVRHFEATDVIHDANSIIAKRLFESKRLYKS